MPRTMSGSEHRQGQRPNEVARQDLAQVGRIDEEDRVRGEQQRVERDRREERHDEGT